MMGDSSQNSENELIARAKSGDYAAFEAIVSKYEGRIFGLAMRLVRHREDAEDITQKTFLSVVEHVTDFREEAPFAAWILRIATNHALKVLRKRRGLDIIPARGDDEAEDYASMPLPDFIADWHKTPEKLASDGETKALLTQALDELSDSLKATFLLRDVEGLSIDDTAKALGIKPGAVKVRLLRARLQLRERLTRTLGDRDRVVQTSHRHASDEET
jgi:RNA polymerase sigma-70 factor (ECF subfamily)